MVDPQQLHGQHEDGQLPGWSGGEGFDFGSEVWFAMDSIPMGSGELEWKFSEGQIEPHLTGTLHLTGVADHCARMRLDYWADEGTVGSAVADSDYGRDHLTTVYGETVCPDDNSQNRYSVDLGEYSDHMIDQVEVTIEARPDNGSWTDEHSQTSHLGY